MGTYSQSDCLETKVTDLFLKVYKLPEVWFDMGQSINDWIMKDKSMNDPTNECPVT